MNYEIIILINNLLVHMDMSKDPNIFFFNKKG